MITGFFDSPRSSQLKPQTPVSLLLFPDSNDGEMGIEFDATWDNDDSGDEEEDDEEEEEKEEGEHVGKNDSQENGDSGIENRASDGRDSITVTDTDASFKLLSLETELMLIKKKVRMGQSLSTLVFMPIQTRPASLAPPLRSSKLDDKNSIIRDLEAAASKAEREAYSASMNVATLQAELATTHQTISSLRENIKGQQGELESKTLQIGHMKGGKLVEK